MQKYIALACIFLANDSVQVLKLHLIKKKSILGVDFTHKKIHGTLKIIFENKYMYVFGLKLLEYYGLL